MTGTNGGNLTDRVRQIGPTLRRDELAYASAAVVVALWSSALAGEDPLSVAGVFGAIGVLLMGVLLGVMARWLGPAVSLWKWMFWFATLTLVLQGLSRL
jgi:hypothetical protein